jgi:hypothetical protein
MKSVKAWAVVRPSGKMVLHSGACPVYWRRKPAQSFIDHYSNMDGCRVLRVEIREVKAKKGAQ